MGMMMLNYPKLSEMYENYQQQKLVAEWQKSLNNIDNGDELSEEMAEDTLSDNVDLEDVVDDLQERTSSNDENMEGILRISTIGLQLPILHGATKENMKTTIASIANTGTMGRVGNYALAGHRNRTYGRNFNRLNEVVEGDKIQVDNGEQQFEYTVTEKLRVKPEEVWVLEGNGEDKELTLVTCDPMINPTHRIIIKGKIID
ncbi:class D sortase [Paenibacillus sp. FA6]|uniref:class D sortase n=1 Tax=Paenibacillus sp. FA6 TaxID=3413029 RepID=UPI003F654A41